MHPEGYNGLESLEDLSLSQYDVYPRMHYQLIKNMAHFMNFTLDIQVTDDYGWKGSNGSFSGMMGHLQRHEIDVGGTGAFIRHDRLDVTDATVESFVLKTAVLFRQPPLSSVHNIFILPFRFSVWISCTLLCVVITIALLVELKLNKCRDPQHDWSSPLDILTLVLGSICQQGYPKWPTSSSAKIILFSVSLTSLFFYTSYSGTIVALLQSTSDSIRTLTDLTNSPLAVGIHDMTYNRISFKETIDPEVKALYNYKVLPRGSKAFMKPKKGIANVRKGLFAFQVEVDQGYKLISDTFAEAEKCGLSEVKLFILPVLVLPVAKRSGYREIFTRQLRWQREVGIFDRLQKLWLPQKPGCGARGGGDYVRVGITEFHPALFVLMYGMIASISILIMEIIYHYKWRLVKCAKRKKKNNVKKVK